MLAFEPALTKASTRPRSSRSRAIASASPKVPSSTSISARPVYSATTGMAKPRICR